MKFTLVASTLLALASFVSAVPAKRQDASALSVLTTFQTTSEAILPQIGTLCVLLYT